MTAEQIHAAISSDITQCVTALDRQRPVGHSLQSSVRLPSGKVVQVMCSAESDGAIVVWFTSDPIAPPSDSKPSTSADDIASVEPLFNECVAALQQGKAKDLERKFYNKFMTIHDACMREGAGTSIMIDAVPNKGAH